MDHIKEQGRHVEAILRYVWFDKLVEVVKALDNLASVEVLHSNCPNESYEEEGEAVANVSLTKYIWRPVLVKNSNELLIG